MTSGPLAVAGTVRDSRLSGFQVHNLSFCVRVLDDNNRFRSMMLGGVLYLHYSGWGDEIHAGPLPEDVVRIPKMWRRIVVPTFERRQGTDDDIHIDALDQCRIDGCLDAGAARQWTAS